MVGNVILDNNFDLELFVRCEVTWIKYKKQLDRFTLAGIIRVCLCVCV